VTTTTTESFTSTEALARDIYTVGGTAATGSKCTFPFEFEGNSYNTCIKTAGHNQFFCGVDPIVVAGNPTSKWGNCDLETFSVTANTDGVSVVLRNGIPEPEALEAIFDVAAGATVAFTGAVVEGLADGTPRFDHTDGTMTLFLHVGPTARALVVRVNDMPIQIVVVVALQPSTFAPSGVLTLKGASNGPGNGRACTFPFTYQKTTYHQCTCTVISVPWCSVQGPSVEVHMQWGLCNTSTYSAQSCDSEGGIQALQGTIFADFHNPAVEEQAAATGISLEAGVTIGSISIVFIAALVAVKRRIHNGAR